MNNTKCKNTNGTYTCRKDANHFGFHARSDYERNAANEVVAVIRSKWEDSYGEVKHYRYNV